MIFCAVIESFLERFSEDLAAFEHSNRLGEVREVVCQLNHAGLSDFRQSSKFSQKSQILASEGRTSYQSG